jgi:hemerythrin superfamily protein
MDAITLLKQDHKTVNGLFRQFEKLGDNAQVSKRKVVDQIIKELSIHASIEENVFYPAVKGSSDELRDDVLEALEEHHVVKWLCSELEGMAPDAERFDAKVTVLIENVRHHVEEEETELFPRVRTALGRNALGEIGDLLAKAKKVAPTRPHPKAPDEPPFNAIAGSVAALIDRVRDAGAGVVADAQRAAKRASKKTSRPASAAQRPTKTTAKRAAKRVAAK